MDAVARVMRLHLKPDKAKLYLENEYNIRMGASTLRRYKQYLREQSRERLYDIAEYGFEQQHINAIDETEAARRKMWENVWKVEDPFKQNIMIQNILNTLPLLSEYYDSTKGVIQKPAITKENPTLQEPEPTEEWA